MVMHIRKALLLVVFVLSDYGLTQKGNVQVENVKSKSDLLLNEEGSGDEEIEHVASSHIKEEIGSGYAPDDEDLHSHKSFDYPDNFDDDFAGSGEGPLISSRKPTKESVYPRTNLTHKDYDLNFEIGEEMIPVHPDEGMRINENTTRFGIINVNPDSSPDVHVVGHKGSDRPTSFFAQPGFLAAVIGGAVVGLLCAILIVMYIVYRMRKKDEGSYALYEPKRGPGENSYAPRHREFFA